MKRHSSKQEGIIMETQVIYYSKTGNTKKLAEAIAKELSVQAQDVEHAELQSGSFVFLGTGSYGKEPGKPMEKFIESNDMRSRNVALFGTSGSGKGSEVGFMETMLEKKDAEIKGKFFCKGRFLIMNRGRPNDKDLMDARTFARSAITR
jgi:flavodoxin I